MLAAEKGHIGVVKYLVDNGADVNQVMKWTDFYGYQSVHSSVLMKAVKTDIVKYLVDNGADVNWENEVRIVSQSIIL
jgi:ankyrin repeat protein